MQDGKTAKSHAGAPSRADELSPSSDEPTAPVRVYIVDDDDAIRESLAMFLASAGYAVGSYSSAPDFLGAALDLPNGCLLSDVHMPEMTGLELLGELSRRRLNFPVIIMTAFGDIPMAIEAVKLGALDFIEKPPNKERLLISIGRAQDAMKTAQNALVDAQDAAERIAKLTPREYDVCTRLVSGLPNKAIASDLDISVRTVEFYRARVMRKTRAVSLSELVRLSLAAGVPIASNLNRTN